LSEARNWRRSDGAAIELDPFSVASAAPAPEGAATGGGFLTEIQVIVDRIIQAATIGPHVGPRQDIPLPGLYAQRTTARRQNGAAKQ
jgi:hypothetical protein